MGIVPTMNWPNSFALARNRHATRRDIALARDLRQRATFLTNRINFDRERIPV